MSHNSSVKSGERIKPDIITMMRSEIRDADGQEVLFTGTLDEDGMVTNVLVAARGNDSAAPALYPYMSESEVVIHNHPSGNLQPSTNDLAIASNLGNQGIGFYIVNNEVTRVYCVSEPVVGNKNIELDMEDVCNVLLPGGELSRSVADYETRDPQVEMTEGIVNVFNSGHINLTEAGTGVGKSFAYIIPSLKWCEQNKGRIVISTATINLQQQLIGKDIPVISKIINSDVKSVLVKGRSNYLCLRRLNDAADENSLFRDKSGALQAIIDWAGKTETGDKSDLSFVPEYSLWNSVCSESDACMGLRCPFRDRCFVLKVRKDAASANILVVNHHLLFSDLAMRMNGAGYENAAVLPPFRNIVFDEAHSIENSATSFFSQVYSKLILYRHIGRIYTRRRGSASGLSEAIRRLLPNPGDFNSLPERIDSVRDAAEALESKTADLMAGSYNLRLTGELDKASVNNVMNAVIDLQTRIISLVTFLKDTCELLLTEDDENSEVFELKVVLQRLKSVSSVLKSLTDYENEEDKIFWIEYKRTGKGEMFYQYSNTPLDISDMMKTAVYEPMDTLVFTSATLTVQKKFTFWKGRVGLNDIDEGIDEVLLNSPFEYRSRVMLGIPDDAPEPSSEEYQTFVADAVLKAVSLSEGRALVLFTSYGMLNRTYDELFPLFSGKGITVMKQGEDDRSRLLDRFNTDVSSVLFATDSFWEGVDAPGDSLKLVIICKLPFRVPTDPIIKARMEAIEARGGNAFMDLSLPEAAMKLKQGFGRLMRRKTDHGIVMILDPRTVRKSYGSILLNTLPETIRSIKPLDKLLEDIENFLYSIS